MSELRVYIVITAPENTIPTAQQWTTMFNAAKAANVLEINARARAAQNYISTSKISLNTTRRAIVSFELEPVNVAPIVSDDNSLLHQRATAFGVTADTDRELMQGVFARMPAALFAANPALAVAVGWDAQTATAFVTGVSAEVIGYGDRVTAIAGVQQWLADNAADWYGEL